MWGYSHIALLFYGLFAKTYFYHKMESFFFTYVSVFLRYQIFEWAKDKSDIFTNKFEFLTPHKYQELIQDKNERTDWDLLKNHRDLVMFAQRKYIARWYEDFDPTMYLRNDDLPYDWDHLIAYYYFDKSRNRGANRHPKFDEYRERFASSAGNFRVWPKSLNRSDSNAKLREKYLIGDNAIPDQSYLTEAPFNLNNVEEVQAASYFNDNNGYWEKAANEDDSDNWHSEDRLENLRLAVQSRNLELYSHLYNSIHWEEWLKQ